MTTTEAAAIPRMTREEFDDLSEAAFAWARHMATLRDTEHAAFHRRSSLCYGRVGRRRGYLGETVCLDCYRGKPWR